MRLASSVLAASLAALIAGTPALAAPAGTVTLGKQGDWDSLDPHRLRLGRPAHPCTAGLSAAVPDPRRPIPR